MVTAVDIRKSLMFSIRLCWRSVCQHPFVSGILLFMLFLYIYFPSVFIFLVYYSPVIACTSLLLGALLVYGEPNIAENEDVKSVAELNFTNRRIMNVTKDGLFKQMHGDGDGEGDAILAASSSREIAEKETHNEKTLANEVEDHNMNFNEKEAFSVGNPAECSTTESLTVETKKPLDNQFESSLGSPWQQVNGRDVSSCSDSDEEESSSSAGTSVADIAPIIDEFNPLLESESLLQEHRSIDSSDAVSRASSQENEFDDGSAEEETEIHADEEDEEAQDEKDNNESIVKWTADDEKNLMDLGTLEIERNRRLENLIAKRRARKLQRFQTDKNLIDLDSDPLPFMEEISRLNIQMPAISAPRCNPFDLAFDYEGSMGLPPIPGSAPSVLLPRRNPFDLPYNQDEERNKIAGENSRTYVEPRVKPYFAAEKKIGAGFASFERQLSEKSDSKESSASESDSILAVVNQDHDLSESESHERASSVSQDVETVDQRSDLSVQVGSEQDQNLPDSVEQEIGDVESSSPVSSSINLEVIDERYNGSSSSFCSEEDDKYNETRIHIEPTKTGLPAKGVEGPDDSQIADPVYDSSPSAQSTIFHIPSFDEDLFSKFKGKEGFITGPSLPSYMDANLLDVVSTPGAILDEGDLISDEVNPRVREIRSVNDASNSDMSTIKNSGMEELVPEIKVHELESNSSKGLDSWMEDTCTEKQDSPICLNILHDKHSSMEHPQALGSDSGSSYEGKFEVKSAELHVSEPSFVDRNEVVKPLNQETVASSTSGLNVNNSVEAPENSSNSLNPKDQIDLLL